MPEATPIATPAPAAAPSVPAVATPAAAPASPVPAAAAPAAPAAASSPAPAAAGEAAPAAKAPPAVIESLIGEAPKPVEGEAAKPAEEAKPAEPTTYDIKLPEGVEADPALIDAAKAIFTEAKVAPEVAQKLATFHGEQMKALGDALVAKQYETWNTTISGWQKEVTADPELGGAKWSTTKAAIEGGLQSVFGVTPTTPADAPQRAQHKAFVAALAYTGAGSNLAILRGLHRMVAARSEGKPVAVGGPSPQKLSAAEKMYPTKQAAE